MVPKQKRGSTSREGKILGCHNDTCAVLLSLNMIGFIAPTDYTRILNQIHHTIYHRQYYLQQVCREIDLLMCGIKIFQTDFGIISYRTLRDMYIVS